MRIVFMGTPDFAVTVLEAAIQTGHEVVGVYTQPDKSVGRKQVLTPSPVKVCAEAHGLSVFQPERIRRKTPSEELAALKPDLILVAAYGQILPQKILDIPPFGCINMHASLLPAYRGAAPIQRAIVNGEKETGITAMMMDAGMDTGDMLDRVTVPIEETDTAEMLTQRLSAAAGVLTETILKRVEAEGMLKGCPQDNDKATYAPMLTREDGLIDWNRSAEQILNQVRGLYPWPATYTFWDGKKLAVFEAKWTGRSVNGRAPGTVEAQKGHMYAAANDQWIELISVQVQGKKRMDAASFLRGYHPEASVLGS